LNILRRALRPSPSSHTPRRLLPAARWRKARSAARRRKAGVAAGYRDRFCQGADHHHRIRLDELPALCGVRRERLSDAAVEIYRHRQGAVRVPGISASTSRPRRPRCWRAASPRTTRKKYLGAVEILFKQQGPFDGSDQGHAEIHRQAERDERGRKSRPARRIRCCSTSSPPTSDMRWTR